MLNKITVISLLSAFLFGCGGSGSKDTDTNNNTNKALNAVADIATSENNQTITIDVLSNDSASDNNVLTLSAVKTAPEFGTASIENDKLIYVPTHNFAGTDTLVYTVSDGTKQVDATVTITVSQSFIIKGQVYENGLENATVTLQTSNKTFTATSMADGLFELNVTLNKTSDMLLLNAKGTGDAEQVELVSMLGDGNKVLSQLTAERLLVSANNNRVNPTSLSTSRYLLSVDKNLNETITNMMQLDSLNNGISAESMVDTAAFIHLLIANPDYQITLGKTTLSLLENDEFTLDSIDNYLIEHQLKVDFESVTFEYSQAFSHSKAELFSNAILFEKITEGQLNNAELIILNGSQPGWLANDAGVLKLDSDKKGKLRNIDWAEPVDVTWSLNTNSLSINLPDNKGRYIHSFGEFREQFMHALDYSQLESYWSSWSGSVYVEIINHSEEVMIINSNTSHYQAIIKSTQQEVLNMAGWVDGDDQPWLGEFPVYTTEPVFSGVIYQHKINSSAISSFTLADLTGDWALPLVYNGTKNMSLPSSWYDFDFVMQDRMTINGDKATGAISQFNFDISITDGVISLNNDEVLFELLPYKKLGKEYQVLVKMYQEGQLKNIYVNKMAKFDGSYQVFLDSLVTELPQLQLSYTVASNPKNWKGNLLNLEILYGNQFNADGTLQEGISASADSEWVNDEWVYGETKFSSGRTLNWENQGGLLTIFRNKEFYLDINKEWDIISVDDEGKVLVLERDIRTNDNNNNGVIDSGESYLLLPPRIKTLKLGDLSDWPEVWANTQAEGFAVSKSDAKEVGLDIPKKIIRH